MDDISEEKFILFTEKKNFGEIIVEKHSFLSFLPRYPRLKSSTLIRRHPIRPKIVSMQSLRVATGAAFSIFYFNFSGSHARAKNTACFLVRRRVNNNKLIYFRSL